MRLKWNPEFPANGSKILSMRYVFTHLASWRPWPSGADDYTGPRPPKPDVLYLVHASNLVPTEVTEAQQEGKKDDTTFSVAGAASSARTPLAEPIFLAAQREDQAGCTGVVPV